MVDSASPLALAAKAPVTLACVNPLGGSQVVPVGVVVVETAGPA